MNLFLRYLAVILAFIVFSCAAQEGKLQLMEPSLVYKTSRSRQSLLRTSIVRQDSLQCLVGASTDIVPGLQMRGESSCPSRYAVQNVNYSVVFHEVESRDQSIKPYWTILIDMDVNPMALGSLTGFLFRYKSLDSMHELFGETGFMYQNLPLTILDINATKQIPLKSPYRNKDNFEIQICPLPFCPINKVDPVSGNCFKINVRIPDKRDRATLNSAIELPPENSGETRCEQPLVTTSSLKTVLVNGTSGDYAITINPESATHDVVTLTDVGRNMISKYLCNVEISSNPDFPQNIVETDKTKLKGCTLIQNVHTLKNDCMWEKVAMLVLVFGLLVALVICQLVRWHKTKKSYTCSNNRKESIYYNCPEETGDDFTITSCDGFGDYDPKGSHSGLLNTSNVKSALGNPDTTGPSEAKIGLRVFSILSLDPIKHFGRHNSSKPNTALNISGPKELHAMI